MKRVFAFTILLGFSLQLLGCMGGGLVSSDRALKKNNEQHEAPKLYLISESDTLNIVVYDEKDLSGVYKVNEEGSISFPLLGFVKVQGLNIYEIEALLEAKLKEGYLKKPDVSVSMEEYRPYSILGEVNGAGNYKFSEGMSVIDAIAVAGGFTYRAQKEDFETLRRGKEGWNRVYISVSEPIRPGDVIYVRERLF